LSKVCGRWQRCWGIWRFQQGLWCPYRFLVDELSNDGCGERLRLRRVRHLSQVRVRRLFGLLCRRIVALSLRLRRGQLLVTVRVRILLLACRGCQRDRSARRYLLLGFERVRLLGLRLLLRYVGCRRVPTFCFMLLLLPAMLSDVILGNRLFGFALLCMLSTGRRRLARYGTLFLLAL
jgi:hypothetical protein